MQPRAEALPTKARPPRDASIEGLRGLAALVVFYHHVLIVSVGGWTAPKWLLWPVDASAAVMVFFILSGYVVGLAYPAQLVIAIDSVRAYAWRRFVRLMPINIAAVLLGCVAATSLDWETILANLFFLQNNTDYAGIRLMVLDANTNLWSLNYEVLYYVLFIPIWVFRARLRIVSLITVGVLLLGWYTPYVPLFLACYAAGFLFWLAGLALAWRTEPADGEQANWPACLLLAIITWKLQGLKLLLSEFPMPGFFGAVVRLYAVDFLPVSVWLLAAVARRTHPWLPAVKILAVIIPAIGMLAHLTKPGSVAPADLAGILCFYVLALTLWRWRPSLNFFRWFGPLGLISYAFYAIARPFQEFVFRHGQALPANAYGFAICAGTVTILALVTAWYLERRIQPALNHVLLKPKAPPAKLESGP